jgi:hypothetical protein
MSNAEDGVGQSLRATLRNDIDENLKRVYEDTLKAEVPDRFKQLLAQLSAKGGKA